ncbi:MAG TPA: hypothetical protein VHK63_01150 [Candidatus Limnocylindria bacterium]|nr:hypothetical protein [Candidatus Limnocylindria bacterium]
MTMQHSEHPQDERLSALAGGDPEATTDASLRAHVDACSRCAGVVDDIGRLRSTLADLPDLAPSRPLQLVPPVAARRGRERMGWLRRLAAPAMAAGAGLAVVGAVGLAAIGAGGMAAMPGAQSGAEDHAAGDREGAAPAEPGATAPIGLSGGATASPRLYGESEEVASARPSETGVRERADESAEARSAPPLSLDGPAPWLVVLVLGAGLFVAGLVLRFAVQPRAG